MSRLGLLSWMLEPTKVHPGPALGPHAARPPSGTGGLHCSRSFVLSSRSFVLSQFALAEPRGAGSSPGKAPSSCTQPRSHRGTGRAHGWLALAGVALGASGQPPVPYGLHRQAAAPASQPVRAESAGIRKQNKAGAICRDRNCSSTLET